MRNAFLPITSPLLNHLSEARLPPSGIFLISSAAIGPEETNTMATSLLFIYFKKWRKTHYYQNIGIGFNSFSVYAFSSQPSLTGTSYRRPGENRAQKCLSPGTNTFTAGIPISGLV